MRIRRKTALEFARENIRLDYGLFDPERMPFCREPLEVMDGARGKRFIMLGSIQSVKTLNAQIVAASTPWLRPRRALWFSQTKPAIDDFVDGKWNPLLDSTSRLHQLFYEDRDMRGRHKLVYRGGSLFVRSANIKINRNSTSAQDIYADEPWTYEPGQLKEISGRMGDYEDRSRFILATSGPDTGGEVHQMIESSDFREWHGRCPCCGSLVPFDFGGVETEHGIKWETSDRTRREDLSWDYLAVRESVRFVPSCCHEPIAYSPGVVRKMNAGGEYLSMNPSHDGRTVTWHWNAFAHRSWPDLVVMWLEANQAKRRGTLELVEDFKRKQLAVDYSEVLEVKPRVEKVFEAGYRLREHWDAEAVDSRGRPFRFMLVDVQKDHYWVSIRKWSRGGESRLHWCERVLTFGDIVDLAAREAVHEKRIFMDSGYNTEQVLRLCGRKGYLALDGVDRKRGFLHEDGIRRIYSEVEVVDAFAGTVHDRKPVGKFLFSTFHARNRLELYRSLETSSGRPYWTVADDTPKWYTDQVANVVQQRKRHPRGGSWYFSYVEVGEDHAHDLEVMGIVAASMAGFIAAESTERPEGEAAAEEGGDV